MTASGTAGHGAELGRYVRLGPTRRRRREVPGRLRRGRATLRPGSTPRRRGCSTPSGCRVPASRPGWTDELPALLATKARVVASIWGRTVDEFAAAADALADAPAGVVAVEVNVAAPTSRTAGACSPTRRRRRPRSMAATAACGRPRWAKLSPNVADLAEIAAAAHEAGAEAVTLVNTLLGDGDRRDDAAGRCWAPAAAACRGRPSTPSPCGPCTTCTRRRPGSADRRCRRRAARRPTPSSCCWPGPARSRSARPRSPTRARRAKVLAGLEAVVRAPRRRPVAELVGAAACRELS